MDNEIMFTIGEDGVLREYKEPYATIECETEEDFEKLKESFERHNKAKKPDFTDEYCDVAYCPNCGKFEFEDGTTTWMYNYCPECGQKLDWSE